MKTLALLSMLALSADCQAQLTVTPLVGDGMVMQRAAAVPVWGWAPPGAAVTVTFDGTPYRVAAAADSTWRVTLPPMEAGGPHELTVEGAGETIRVENILVGDVWIASGQSNMEWTVADARDAQKGIAAARDPGIRHFKVPQSWAQQPSARLAGGAWQQADPAHVGAFSAVGYFFARALRQHRDVPIGIVNTTWGGTRIEPWMSAEMLGLGAGGVEEVWAREREREQDILNRVRARIGTLPTRDEGLVDGVARWAAPHFDDGAWFSMPVPAQWEAHGFDGMDGVAWYRTTFSLTADEAAQGVTLGLGMIDDSDISWVNGVEVGRMDNAWNVARVYAVPPEALHAGANVIAVRVEDFRGGGGIAGPPEAVFVETAAGRHSLAGDWRFMVGRVSLGAGAARYQVPTALWNKMVHPLTPFPVKGVIWYQGESNADRLEDAEAYDTLFTQMITGWRAAWRQPALPFLWVQLANYMAPDSLPKPASAWATLREAQSAALALPHTAQAVILDLGEAGDIHPRNKQDVGVRLALAARKVAYGEDLVYSGPVYQRHELRDGRVVVSFDHVGGGLVARGGTLGGFAVAGEDGVFAWAEARIEGDTVVVWSEAVPHPVAVRYAWGDNPDRATLYNAEGLPAAPFRTDRP